MSVRIKESAENYLETILVLKDKKGTVRSVDVANELGFAKPSVSVAMKTFREEGYITVEENGNGMSCHELLCDQIGNHLIQTFLDCRANVSELIKQIKKERGE